MPPRRTLPLLLAALIGLGTIAAVVSAVRFERQQRDERAQESAEDTASRARLAVGLAETTTTDIAGAIAIRGGASPGDFRRLAWPGLSRAGLTALSWVSRVPAAEREEFERRNGPILAFGGASPTRAGPRAEYFPLTLIASRAAAGTTRGVDLGAQEDRMAAFSRATSTGGVSLAGPMVLLGDTRRGIVLVAPVFRGAQIPTTPIERRERIIGFVTGAYRLDAFLAAIRAGDDIVVRDGDRLVVGDAGARTGATTTVLVGDRSWAFGAVPGATARSLPLIVGVSGLALSLFAVALALVLRRRDRVTSEAVTAATRNAREAGARYQALAENSPDVVARYDRDLRCLYASPAIEEATGRPPEAFVGRPIDAELPEDLGAQLAEAVRRVFDTGEPGEIDYALPRDGGERTFHARLGPERDSAGAIASVIAVSRDVTASREAARALRESEERYRALVTGMADGVVVHDADGVMISVNPAAEAIVGVPASETVGMRQEDAPWRRIREDGSPFPIDDLPSRRARATGRPQRAAIMGIVAPSGETTWIQSSSEPVETARDGVVTVTCFTDITVRIEAEREHGALRRVATFVAGGPEPRAVFEMIAAEAAGLTGAVAATIIRFERGNASGYAVGSWGEEGVAQLPYDQPIALGPGTAVGDVAVTGRATLAGRADAPIGSALRPGADHVAVAAPIVVRGELWGAVTTTLDASEPIPPSAPERLERLGELASLAITSADARLQLATLASTDPLTGLPNRRAFQDRMAEEAARARRTSGRLSLVVFDIDHFKLINDDHGHVAGDRVLVELAERLAGEVREGETVARIGGEEFALVLPRVGGDEAAVAAERLRSAVGDRPFAEAGTVTVSIGVAELADVVDADALFRAADAALFQAKRDGRNRVVRHAPERGEAVARDG